MNETTCITEIMEKELRERNAKLNRRLQAAIAALGILEAQYKFHAMKNQSVPLDSIPGYLHLKELSCKE